MNTFDVKTGKLYIGDPVYKKNSADAKFFLPKAKNGRWVCRVEEDEKVFGSIINKLIVSYSEEESRAAGIVDANDDFHRAMSMLCGKAPDDLKVETASINAESGMAGIFDYKSYRNDKIVENTVRISNQVVCDDEPWYSICCDRVLSENKWGVIPQGCVSAAKDGVINVTAKFNMFGEAEFIEIDFSKDNAKFEDSEDSEDSEDTTDF